MYGSEVRIKTEQLDAVKLEQKNLKKLNNTQYFLLYHKGKLHSYYSHGHWLDNRKAHPMQL